MNQSSILIFLLLVSSVGGCQSAPSHQTPIGEGSSGKVYLETVPQEGFKASHPISLPLPTLYTVLSGVEVREPRQLFQTLLSGNAQALSLFSEPNISFLAKGLRRGLQQASPQEVIRFSLFHTAQAASDVTEGTVYHHDSNLYITLTQYPSSFQTPPTSSRSKKQLKDVNNLYSKELTFTPETALRTSDVSQSQKVAHGPTIVIHYSSLVGAPDQTRQSEHAEHLLPESDAPISQNDSDSAIDAGVTQTKGPERLEGVVIQQQQEIYDLRRELDHIQRDLKNLQNPPAP